jgi:DNA mismatch repair protein MutS2
VVGDEVELARLGLTGDVVEILPTRGEVVVRSRGKRFQVPAAELVAVPREARPAPARGAVTYAEPESAPDELDLRGLSADEIDLPLAQAVDRAVAGNLKRLRVIHGKGGGVLRQRVQTRLAADPRVRSFRLGQWHEGGSGVTVAELT